jgi:predicted Zn-dependent protease
MPVTFSTLGSTYIMLGQYSEAIAILKDCTQREPDFLNAHVSLAAAYMLAGKESEALAESAEVVRIAPSFSLEQYAKGQPWKNETDFKVRVVEPLRRAGLK